MQKTKKNKKRLKEIYRYDSAKLSTEKIITGNKQLMFHLKKTNTESGLTVYKWQLLIKESEKATQFSYQVIVGR